MGDPGGICSEITQAAWRALRNSSDVFFLVAPGEFAGALDCETQEISSPAEAAEIFSAALPVFTLEAEVNLTLGQSDPANTAAVIASIERAVELATTGPAGAVITNPIQKATLMNAGFAFPGHTEFLADLTKDIAMPDGRTRGPIMMLASEALRSVPVTIHQSVREAVASLSEKQIVQTAQVTDEALRHEFGIDQPRLAISGLNPHAGENGEIGDEDQRLIAPAIETLRKNGVNAVGPLPADTMFHAEARATYDAAICMLHDQALIPAKALAFHDAVNVTLGLPVIRTSPDHGTALDIAGKGAARADSLIAAITLASKLARRRAAQ